MTAALDYLRRATDFLRERGVGNPRLDAEVLLADVLGVDRVGVYLSFDRPLSDVEVARYREGLRRRGRREPLQHIRGRQEFFSRDFAVDRRALVPRPETEGVVEAALEGLRGNTGARVVDVGTGSGAIAVTLALEASGSVVFATDVDPGAVALARENADRLGARVDVREGDLFADLDDEAFDLVVSNPPYVPSDGIDGLEPEVREFDPRRALDGGPDGLDVVRRLVAAARERLAPGGRLVLEVGEGQAAAVGALLDAAGFGAPEVRRDLAGVERVLAAGRA